MSHQHTILLVEDNPDLRDAIDQLLYPHGYQVIATGDGLRAVEMAEEYQPSAALVDLLIPGQSGFQVTAALKARFGDAIRVAVMSASVSRAHQDYAAVSGAERFLPKPFTTTELLDLVSALCPLPASAPSSPARRTVKIGS